MKEIVISIGGMSCEHCIKRVKEALKRAGVEEAEVELGKARIVFDEKVTDFTRIKSELEQSGYTVLV